MTHIHEEADPNQIVAVAQEAELALIAGEKKAARRLAAARDKLEKELRNLQRAQKKVDERRESVARAESALADARRLRLAGMPLDRSGEAQLVTAKEEPDSPPPRD